MIRPVMVLLLALGGGAHYLIGRTQGPGGTAQAR